MGRKPSFNKILAVELFKVGMNYPEIAEKLNSTSEAVRKVIKRNAAELNKNPINKYEVIGLFKNGLSYKEIAKNLKSTEDAIKKVIKRNAPELMKEAIDKNKITNLFKNGLIYEEIAKELNSTEEAVRKVIKRNAPDLLKKKKEKQQSNIFEPSPESFELVNLGFLSVEDRKQLMNERTYGLNNSESMSTKAFLKCIWQSYKTDERTGRVKFDSSRGAITKDVPPSYMPGAEFKNKFNCLIINSAGEKESINIRAYDNFYAREEARRKVNGNVAILKCEKMS